eukprot:6466225-Amphidinium_carterae.1
MRTNQSANGNDNLDLNLPIFSRSYNPKNMDSLNGTKPGSLMRQQDWSLVRERDIGLLTQERDSQTHTIITQ